MLDVTALRQDFPILRQNIQGKPLVYFDNACMSLRPQTVIEAMTRYYTEWSACAGRSNHRLAQKVADEVHAAREKVARFIHAKQTAEIVFTRNATEGINLVANTLELKPGEMVLTGGKEHNSNLVPWLKLAKERGVTHMVIPPTADNLFDLDAYQQQLSPAVKLVAIGSTANLDGVSVPVKEIAQAAHAVGAKVLVDAAQTVPHQVIDVQDWDADWVAFSGHKMLGPSGIGVLYGKYDLLEAMPGFLVGGDTVEWTTYTNYKHLPVPEKFEAGLQDYAGIIGLGAAVDYLAAIGWRELAAHEQQLNRIITDGIRGLDRVKIIGPAAPELRGGIVSFTVDGADAHQISLMLDEAGAIMVRSGQHCVHSWFAANGITSSVRASLYLYNTEAEAAFFVDQLKKILAVI